MSNLFAPCALNQLSMKIFSRWKWHKHYIFVTYVLWLCFFVCYVYRYIYNLQTDRNLFYITERMSILPTFLSFEKIKTKSNIFFFFVDEMLLPYLSTIIILRHVSILAFTQATCKTWRIPLFYDENWFRCDDFNFLHFQFFWF